MDNLKYFTDENGNIFIQAPNNQRRNRVTNVFDDKTGELITWNVEESKDEIKEGRVMFAERTFLRANILTSNKIPHNFLV